MPASPTPRSPRSPSAKLESSSSAPTVKTRKSVRLPARPSHDDSSSEDDLKIANGDGRLEVESLPHRPRHSSYPGAKHETSPSTKQTDLNGSSQSSQPKITRSVTSTGPSRLQLANAFSTPGVDSAVAPAPAVNDFADWRQKLAEQRASSSRAILTNSSLRRTGRDESGLLSSVVNRIGAGLADTGGIKEETHLPHLGSDSEDDDLELPNAQANGRARGIAPASKSAVSPGVLEQGPVLPPPSAPVRTPSDSAEDLERIEWQNMLASVLSGDVLRGESSRIGEERGGDEEFRAELARRLWWQTRAKLRGRTEEQERKRVEERRQRVVDTVLEEVEKFVVKKTSGPAGVNRRLSAEDTTKGDGDSDASEETNKEIVEAAQVEIEASALDQVTYILQKLSLIEGLYPHTKAFRADKVLYDSPGFQARVDALTSWSTVVYLLQGQLATLQKWTGSGDLDITKPNTTQEKALVGKNRYHPLDNKAKAHAQATNDQTADDSTFLERIMKEDNLQRTFEKRIFGDLRTMVFNAKESVINHLPLFEELELPNFQFELVRLIGFPCRLVIEALKVRLDAASKLIDPNDMVVDDMIANFRLTIILAVALKRQYEEIVEPDPEGRWLLPSCIPSDYDAVLLNGLRMFFRLLHWKLKSGSSTIYFRETEILDNEWDFLYPAGEAVPGGDMVVAERFCALTNKLMTRACRYFDEQIRKPMLTANTATTAETAAMLRKSQRGDVDGEQSMPTEEMLIWYGKILDAVRMRYRKLQRFGRRLVQRFDDSAEYHIEDDQVQSLSQQLADTGHFLVYDVKYAEQRIYMFASPVLWGDPSAIHQILQRVFPINSPISRQTRRGVDSPLDDPIGENGLIPVDGEDNLSDLEDAASYLLIITPTAAWEWNGATMTIDLEEVDHGLEDNRLRLITDGLTTPLSVSKEQFLKQLVNAEDGESIVQLTCINETQAHLPRIRHHVNRIMASNYKLTEKFIESASNVSQALKGLPGAQDMTESWYQFASDHGKRAINHIDPGDLLKFKKLLMRLAISWCQFICRDCDPSDRKTFRWTVTALRMTWWVTEDTNILYLDAQEFQLLRATVSKLVLLLISHFDILGARSGMLAKKEAERLEDLRRLQKQQENIDDDFIPRTPSPSGQHRYQLDRSIRVGQEERLRLIAELESTRVGFSNDQHLIGQVLDEQVSEDRALVFLAASSSNIALRWQQGAFIGGGANGNVYIGFNLDSGGIMAVKEIRVQDLSNSPALYKQIKDESDVMSMLSHPNIVEYFGIEVHRDRVFIFQEYCEGGSLANQLEHGRIEEEEVVSYYGWQMLCGLQYLHSKGIEHRDVKPENILLGSGSTIKFVDFGAAKVIAKGNRTMAKTRAIRTKAAGEGPAVMNSLAGTPMYMAPEVIRANEKSGHLGSADIWSMGCVLLEISTGRKPWSNLDNEWAIMFHIGIATQAPPLPEHGELSELGIDFIDRCLTLDASERPSAAQLVEHEWIAPMAQTFYEQEGSYSLPSSLAEQVEATAHHGQLDFSQAEEYTPSEEFGSLEATPIHSESASPGV